SGLAGNPNDLALMLNLLLPLAGALLICERRLSRRLIAGAALLLSIAAVIVTFSRAGFLTLVAIALMSLAACARRRRPGAAVALLVVALAIPPLLPKGYLDRLETITDMSADRTGSAQGRWSDFGAAIEIAASNPILGVGIGQDILALNELRGAAWRSVHNVYLQYAIDLGLPGLLLFLALFWGSVKSARRVQQRAAADPKLRDLSILGDAITVSLIGFAVAAFFHPAAYQFYFFCLAGLAVALKNACPPEARLKPGTTTQSGSG
ncbi:MAG: O-antigen ligase family protein, partial [Acidobacteria bacterium]|nr:O-antigen ligase family protein [Acidobacteriota bacterium]